MTFTKTNTTLLELAESFKYAGTVAHQSGLNFETASAAFGVLGDAGIKGSHAGTTLRMMLLNMMNPTKRGQEAWDILGINTKDKNGNLRNLSDILSDLHEKQQTMSAGDFSTLINKMFRVTAAPGALALINNVAKMQEVTGLNKKSMGLASDLADEKKNTIQGLWYQMTSAFTETGMQGFEQMQGVIRDFLQRMIELMKSTEFATALRNAMDMFLKIANVIVGVFKGIMTVWNWIPNWGKTVLQYFIRIQMSLGIAAGVVQSIWSTTLMIRGLFMGDWLSKFFLKPLFTALTYMVRIYNIEKSRHNLNKGQAIFNALGGGLLHGGSKIKQWFVGGSTVGNVVANSSNKTINTLTEIGNTTLWGAIKGFSRFFLTNPIGWGVMAAGAITYIGYKIYDAYKITEAARQANEAWAQSYRNLNVDKLNLSDPDALMIGNMRIFNNELLTQNERIAQSTELWHRYWIEKNRCV